MSVLLARNVSRNRAWSGLRAFEATYAPHAVLEEHEHRRPIFTFVLRGEFDERAGGTTRLCRRGDVIFRAAHETHSNVFSERGTASLNVELDCETWDALAERGRLDGRVLRGELEWHALAVWCEFHRDDHASALAMEEAIAVLCSAAIAEAARSISAAARRLEAAAEYIGDGLRPLPGLVEVARVVGVHPMHLAKLFRRRFGYSMGEYVRRRRIAWACGELEDESQTVAAIALRAGFADHAHFTRTFRRLTHCTPKEFRARMRSLSRRGAASRHEFCEARK